MKKGLFGIITLAAFATCVFAAEATVNAGEIHQKISGFGVMEKNVDENTYTNICIFKYNRIH